MLFSFTLDPLNASIGYVPKFTRFRQNVSVTVQPGGGGSVTGARVYDCGQTAILTATPEFCWIFDR